MTVDDLTRKDREREAAAERAAPWRDFLHLAEWGHGVPVFKRLDEALYAVRGWRRTGNYSGQSGEEVCLAVRVVADTFANQIQAAAGDGQDEATIAWVVAGLRCPSQPFCTGCTSCQTVTSPLRPAAPVRSGWL